MNYKDLYNEIHYALWGGSDENEENLNEYGEQINEGYLISIHDPFRNYQMSLDNSKTEEVQKIFYKFADKLYADTKDEYAIKILQEFADYVARSYVDGDFESVSGTKYDPEFVFSDYDPKNNKEIKKHTPYIYSFKYECEDESKNEYEVRKYFFKQDALNYFKEQKEYMLNHLAGLEDLIKIEKDEEDELIFTVDDKVKYTYKVKDE